MVLLKHCTPSARLNEKIPLHSTMVLLKLLLKRLLIELLCPLHSTMVLLKLKSFTHLEELENHFTFHYGLIKTACFRYPLCRGDLLYIPLWSY